MRADHHSKTKQRVLKQAVQENLAVIQGLPPRELRPRYRLVRLWLRRAPLMLLAVTLAGSTYVVSNELRTSSSAAAGPPARTALAPHRHPGSSLLAPAHATLEPGTLQPLDSAAFPLSVRRVVLDAGHGGTDPGTSATARTTEKEITLDIEQRLARLLRSHGFEVVHTRPDDRFIALRERAQAANSSGSDIFVSIHVNSVSNPAHHGVETYYLGPTNDPKLTKLAAAENIGSGYSLADMRKLLDGVYADVRRDESHRLAAAVQEQLYGGLRNADPGLQNWGVKRAPFIVLVATEMPAVLAEVGCLSNEHEAAMLRKPEYRQQVADALLHGIRAYAGVNEPPQKKGT